MNFDRTIRVTSIVITYRRDDIPVEAHRFRDALAHQVGREAVAMTDDETGLPRPLDTADIVIAVIGQRWLGAMRGRESRGERDEVRSVIASALRRGLTLILVRVGRPDAMPAVLKIEDMPGDIRGLAIARSYTVSTDRFDADTMALAGAIRPAPAVAMGHMGHMGQRMPGNSMLKMWLWAAGVMAATVVFANLMAYLSGSLSRPGGTTTAAGTARPGLVLPSWTSEGRIRRAIEAALSKGRRPDEARRCQSALIEATDTGTIVFDTASTDLDLASHQTLDKLAQIIRNCPDFIIEVEGHTDSAGEPAANQRLSERRAGSVREYLLRAGVQSASLSAIGYGDARPVAPNDTPANMARNRRIEFNITAR